MIGERCDQFPERWEKVLFYTCGGGYRNKRSFPRFLNRVPMYQIRIRGMTKNIVLSEVRHGTQETPEPELGIECTRMSCIGRRTLSEYFRISVPPSDGDHSFVAGTWERLTGVALLRDGETSRRRNPRRPMNGSERPPNPPQRGFLLDCPI